MVLSGVVWRGLLLGLVCLVDCVVLVDLMLGEWRGRRATRNDAHAAETRNDSHAADGT